MQTGEAGNQTVNLPFSRQPALPPEPWLPPHGQETAVTMDGHYIVALLPQLLIVSL